MEKGSITDKSRSEIQGQCILGEWRLPPLIISINTLSLSHTHTNTQAGTHIQWACYLFGTVVLLPFVLESGGLQTKWKMRIKMWRCFSLLWPRRTSQSPLGKWSHAQSRLSIEKCLCSVCDYTFHKCKISGSSDTSPQREGGSWCLTVTHAVTIMPVSIQGTRLHCLKHTQHPPTSKYLQTLPLLLEYSLTKGTCITTWVSV